MAQTPLNKKELEELLQLSDLLEKGLSRIDLENLNQSGNSARVMLDALRTESEAFTRDISSAAEAFRRVVEEVSNTNVGVKEVNRSFNKLTSIVDKIQYHQRGISKLTEKDISKLQQQAKQEKERLGIASNILAAKKSELESSLQNNEAEVNILQNTRNLSDSQTDRLNELLNQQKKLNQEILKTETAQNNISGIISDQDFHYNNTLASLSRINNELNDTQKLMGLGGTAVEGLEKALNSLGFGALANKLGINEAKEQMEETAETIRLAGGNVDSFANKLKVLKSGFASMGSSLMENLRDPLIITGFLITEIISAFKSVDSAIGDLAKGFDMSYNGAANLRMELTDIANLSGDVAVTTKGLQESMMAVGQTLGSNAMLNEKDLVTFTKLREQAGYTNEELAGIQKLTLATGGNLEDNTASFLGSVAALNGQNKLTINAKQLLKEVANVSDSIKLSIGGTTEKLAEAAFKAKQFGINLQQADHIAESLLDFESSLASELSAELITGKDLNFERARLLAINGDIAGASAEILKQVGGTAEFTKMNRIQQEAIAKSVGMTRDDLAKSLMDREALVALSGVEGKDAKEKYDNLVKQVGVEEAKKRLGNEALANQFQQQSVQERFTQAVEKLKEIFVSLVEPLMPVLDVFADIMGIVGPVVGVIGTLLKYTIQWGKYLLIPYGIMKGMQLATKGMAVLNTILIRQNATKLAQNQAQAAVDGTRLGLNTNILGILGLQNAARAYSLAQATTGNTLTAIMAAMQQTILGTLVMQGWNLGKNLIKYIGLTLQAGYRMVMENTIVASIMAQGASMLSSIGTGAIKLAQAIGIASANLVATSALTLGVGTAVALAAAAGGIAYLYSVTKGNDIVSPGYGKRTLMSPEGAIALNDKDTVIAGTNLGGGRGNTSASQQNNSPTPQQDNSALIEELRAMRQEQAKSNNKPVIVENSMNGTRFGTAVAMNTYKIQ
jgi:hypothetical protein